jgi:pyruvate oxidase/acetolactate synthase-1/2/3 large subunit
MAAEIIYSCTKCNHLHNQETEGDFENLPDNFQCPECAAPKQEYKSELWYSV